MEHETQAAPDAVTAPEGVDAGVLGDQPGVGGSEDAAPLDPNTLVTVKIDGTEQQVPLGEALAGYQRQSDYTRKSQSVAQREQELAQADALYKAFEADPIGTLDLLNEQLADLRDNGTFENEEPDPVQQRLDAHEQFIQQQQQEAAVQSVNTEIAKLKAQFGDFDREALLQHAIDLGGVPLKAALADMLLDGYHGQNQQNAEITQQKREAFQPARGGGAHESTGRPAGQIPKSIKEALYGVLEDEGLTALPPITNGM